MQETRACQVESIDAKCMKNLISCIKVKAMSDRYYSYITSLKGDKTMFEQNQKRQDSLEQMLKDVENNPSLYVELCDAELVAIVGGAYMNAIIATPTKKGTVCTCICNQSMCDFGACSQCDKPSKSILA
ncbi:MAG: hypothetical protein AB1589_36040 [Cyanobacteriota bacterium]